MPNRRLTEPELEWAGELLKEISDSLGERSGGDADLLFALRRKIFKELIYAERKRPMERVKLKRDTRALQNDRCAICQNPLPPSYTVLDQLEAARGYVPGNVRVLCEQCDRAIQMKRRYATKSN